MYTYTNPEQTWSYSVAGIVYTQGKQNSFQVGTEITQNQYDISLGVWYRGSVNFRNYDALTVTLSINLAGRSGDGYKVRGGVAHDAPIGAEPVLLYYRQLGAGFCVGPKHLRSGCRKCL